MDPPVSALNISTLSPLEVLDLEILCGEEKERRNGQISQLLTTRYRSLDTAFIKVLASTHDRTEGMTRFSYFIRHPRESLDPVKYYPLIVASGRHHLDRKYDVWVVNVSTADPSQHLVDKIKSIDAELRGIYESWMRARPASIKSE